MKCYFDLFCLLNYWDYVFCNLVVLYCVLYWNFYLYNKSAVTISFLLGHRRSRSLPRSRPSCSPAIPKLYYKTIRNWWTWSNPQKCHSSIFSEFFISAEKQCIKSIIYFIRLILTFFIQNDYFCCLHFLYIVILMVDILWFLKFVNLFYSIRT